MRTKTVVKYALCTSIGTAAVAAGAVALAGDSVGPDVTVWRVGSGINTYGTQGDGNANLAIATTSCNHGDEELDWYSNTSQHPVIAQNMYRLRKGRFEHIGMSWLKHGFFALSQNLCGPCQGTNGDTLGIDCADTYSAGLNASGLGPRSDVNATTGESTADPSFPADSPHNGRIMVAESDVLPALNSGAQYFIEGHYVAEDDAAAGNDDNNASCGLANA